MRSLWLQPESMPGVRLSWKWTLAAVITRNEPHNLSGDRKSKGFIGLNEGIWSDSWFNCSALFPNNRKLWRQNLVGKIFSATSPPWSTDNLPTLPFQQQVYCLIDYHLFLLSSLLPCILYNLSPMDYLLYLPSVHSFPNQPSLAYSWHTALSISWRYIYLCWLNSFL